MGRPPSIPAEKKTRIVLSVLAAARGRLMEVFDLSELQATYILDLQLRRLTKFSRLELEAERAILAMQTAALAARQLHARAELMRHMLTTARKVAGKPKAEAIETVVAVLAKAL